MLQVEVPPLKRTCKALDAVSSTAISSGTSESKATKSDLPKKASTRTFTKKICPFYKKVPGRCTVYSTSLHVLNDIRFTYSTV